MQAISNFSSNIMNSEETSSIHFEDIEKLHMEGKELIENSRKIIQEIKMQFGFPINEVDSNITLKSEKKEKCQTHNKHNGAHTPDTLSMLLDSESTLTHEASILGEFEEKKTLVESSCQTNPEDIRNATVDADDGQSEAVSFVTASEAVELHDEQPAKYPGIILPDFSHSSFKLGMLYIQKCLGEEHGSLTPLIPMLNNAEAGANANIVHSSSTLVNLSNMRDAASSHMKSTISPLLHSKLDLPSLTTIEPIVAPTKTTSIFTSPFSYLSGKCQNILPSNLRPSTIASKIVETKPNFTSHLQKRLGGLIYVPTFFQRKCEVHNVSETLGNPNISSCTSDSQTNAKHFLKRLSPRYSYQIRFLVQTYGLKETARILVRN